MPTVGFQWPRGNDSDSALRCPGTQAESDEGRRENWDWVIWAERNSPGSGSSQCPEGSDDFDSDLGPRACDECVGLAARVSRQWLCSSGRGECVQVPWFLWSAVWIGAGQGLKCKSGNGGSLKNYTKV